MHRVRAPRTSGNRRGAQGDLFAELLVPYTSMEQYDAFINPANWPDEGELTRLRVIYEWDAPSRSLRSPFVEAEEP
jgi:hypothetical protein